MRSVKQFLLWAGMGALALTPCAYGRSITGDSTARFRGAVQADFTFHRSVERLRGFSGKSVFLNPEFLNPDSRAGGDLVFTGHLFLPIKPVVHDGHAVLPDKVVHFSGGNQGFNAPPAPSQTFSNGSDGPPPPPPSQNFFSNPPSGPNPVPSGNSVQNGVASVPEGGTSASYLVPAALVMFGGIFLTGLRRQRTPWQANS